MLDEKNRSESTPDFPENAECRECGYALRGLPSNVCPECGSPFDPEKPLTYHVPSKSKWYHLPPLSSWMPRYGRPPGKVHVVLLIGAIVFLLADISSPGQTSSAFLLSAGLSSLVFVLAFDWSFRLIARFCYRRRPRTHLKRRWVWTPVLVAILLSNAIYPWPAYIRFQFSRSAFEEVAADKTEPQDPTERVVGSYLVKHIERYPDGRIYFHIGFGFINRIGFWYIPTGTAPPKYPYFIRHQLDENWYIGGEDF